MPELLPDAPTQLDDSPDVPSALSRLLPGEFLIRRRIEGASSLQPVEFERLVHQVYVRLLRGIDAAGRHAVRLWNFIPRINEPLMDGMDRYRVFNRARYAAFVEALPGRLPRAIPAATGVGHDAEHVEIVAIVGDAEGIPVENPRQVPAYRYSEVWGPRAPCFARATIAETGAGMLLFLGGTSSVRGEETVFADDLRAQLDETFVNLDALRDEADGVLGREMHRCAARTHHLQVYVRRAEDAAAALAAARTHFGADVPIQLRRADICRPELLVEIEGVMTTRPAGALGDD